MKERFPGDDEFNSPAEMLARLVFALSLAGFVAGFVCTLGGIVAGDLRWLAIGVMALALSWLGRDWLRDREQVEKTTEELETFVTPGAPPADTHVAELTALLREWDALERKRGSPGFDPWAVQAVRHDIHEIVERDPALEQLFHVHRHNRAA